MDSFDKEYYKIREVAEIIGVTAATLRYWEGEFDTYLKPTRTASKARLYRPADIRKLRIIHYLVKERKLKIDAAKQYLKSNPQNVSRRLEILDDLRDVRSQLADMLTAIGGRKL